jgi:1-acyl-sn-glycerol-3-phosphate acyltransferase
MHQALWNLFCRAVTCGSKVRVTGQEFIPDGPKIFACNHPTSFDPCYVYPYTGNAAILMTRFIFDLPFAGRLVSGCGFVPVAMREKPVKFKTSAYALALNTLLQGRNLLVAPEGKMTDNKGGRPHQGAARLAYVSGEPIVSMGLRHEGEVKTFYLKGQRIRFMPRGKTFLNIGRPFCVKDDDLEWHTDSLMAYISVLAH